MHPDTKEGKKRELACPENGANIPTTVVQIITKGTWEVCQDDVSRVG